MKIKSMQTSSLKLLESYGIFSQEELNEHISKLSMIAFQKCDGKADYFEFEDVQNNGLMIDQAGKGVIDVSRFVDNPFKSDASFSFKKLSKFVRISFVLLDSLHLEVKSSDPVFSIDGLADALLMLGYQYESISGRKQAEIIVRKLRNYLLDSSIRMALERGANESLDRTSYVSSDWAKTIPKDTKRDIVNYGLRFKAHLWLHNDPLTSLSYFNGSSSEAIPPLRMDYRWPIAAEGYLREDVCVTNRACLLYRVKNTASSPSTFRDVTEVSLDGIMKMRQSVFKYMDGYMSPLDERVKRFAHNPPKAIKPARKYTGFPISLQAIVLRALP